MVHFAYGHRENESGSNACCRCLKEYHQSEEWLQCPVCKKWFQDDKIVDCFLHFCYRNLLFNVPSVTFSMAKMMKIFFLDVFLYVFFYFHQERKVHVLSKLLNGNSLFHWRL